MEEKQEAMLPPPPRVAGSTPPMTTSQRGTVPVSELKYVPPGWSSCTPLDTSFELLKGGVLVDTVLLKSKPFYVVGRDQRCDIPMEHLSVSRQHAALQTNCEGEVFVFDLGSVHGTFHNKRRIPAKEFIVVTTGDMLTFGNSTRCLVLCGGKEQARDIDARIEKQQVREKLAIQHKKKRQPCQEGEHPPEYLGVETLDLEGFDSDDEFYDRSALGARRREKKKRKEQEQEGEGKESQKGVSHRSEASVRSSVHKLEKALAELSRQIAADKQSLDEARRKLATSETNDPLERFLQESIVKDITKRLPPLQTQASLKQRELDELRTLYQAACSSSLHGTSGVEVTIRKKKKAKKHDEEPGGNTLVQEALRRMKDREEVGGNAVGEEVSASTEEELKREIKKAQKERAQKEKEDKAAQRLQELREIRETANSASAKKKEQEEKRLKVVKSDLAQGEVEGEVHEIISGPRLSRQERRKQEIDRVLSKKERLDLLTKRKEAEMQQQPTFPSPPTATSGDPSLQARLG